MKRDEPKSLKELAHRTRYPVDAFHFIRHGLDFTVHRTHKNPQRLPESKRHVTGRQLCEGLREYALEQYGLMARTVLRRWNIARTDDFGRIVFSMVEAGLMQATSHDSIRDFESVYSFDEALEPGIRLDRVPPNGLEPAPVKQKKPV